MAYVPNRYRYIIIWVSMICFKFRFVLFSKYTSERFCFVRCVRIIIITLHSNTILKFVVLYTTALKILLWIIQIADVHVKII